MNPPPSPGPHYLPPAPSALSPEAQAAVDANNLKLLEIAFYIAGGLTALNFLWISFMAVFFTITGTLATIAAQHARPTATHGDPPPAAFFLVFGLFFGAMLFFVFACLEIYAGRCLRQRRNALLIQIVAAFYCLMIPWGTAIGVCTFILLNRSSVRALFERP